MPTFVFLCRSIIIMATLVAFAPQVKSSTSEDYEKALRSFQFEKYDEAYIHLKNSLQKDPQNLAAKLLMGRILLINGYLNAAEMEFVEAYEMGADVNLIASPLGNTWLFLNKYEDVVRFDGTEGLTGENVIDWLQIKATACIRLDDLVCAESSYGKILDATSTFIPAIQGMASIAIQKGMLMRASTLIEQAESLDPNNAITWRLKGQLAYQQGDHNTATDYLQKALTFNRDDPIALRNLVDLYLQANDYDRAKLFVDEIIQETPNDPLAILLNSWLESRESKSVVDSEKLQQLNEFMAQLSPELISSQPMLLYISGLTNFFNNNMEKAAVDFNSYLQKEPEDIQAVLMLSQVYLATQQYKQALLLLTTHETELIESPDSALILGDLYIKQNKAFKAERLIQRLELRYPDNNKIQLFKIKLMAARGRREDAVKILEANFDRFKENSTFLFTYSLMHLQGGEFELALKGANLLAQMFPDESEVFNLLAGIYIRSGDLETAKIQIDKALSLNPTLFPAKFNLAAIHSRQGNFEASEVLIEELLVLSPQHTESMLLSGYNAANQGRPGEAKEIYLSIMDFNPNHVGTRERLVNVFRGEGDYETALYHLDKLLKDDFDNPDYLLDKAGLQLALRDPNNAIKTLNIVENFISDSPQRLIRFSEIALALGEESKALQAMENAQTLAPNNAMIVLSRARLLLSLGRVEAASGIVSPLAPSQQRNPNYWHTLGTIFAEEGRDDDAVAAYKQALSLDVYFSQPVISLYNYALRDRYVEEFITTSEEIVNSAPDNLLVKNLLAQYLFFIRDYEQSRALYESLIEEPNLLNPAQAHNRLAIMALETSISKALSHIEIAYSLNANDAKILDTYGWIQALRGNYEHSLELLREAYARDAQNPNVRYHLGYTLAKLNRLDEARVELEYAVTVERPFYLRPDAQKLLDAL
ncbi:PEP-CTERM system TPR-repeat protein PrsT [Alteromonas sp. KUL49]|nr:PEP-CTERM system TPR-repeat protein PrsT [Alteromonas sp. KUL49]